MIELVVLVAVVVLVGWLVVRKQKQRSAAIASGEEAGVPCMLKWPAQGARWKAGRLLIGGGSGGSLVWQPSSGKQEVPLPTDLRRTGLRPPTMREGMTINPSSRIVECQSSSDGDILIAVMPLDLPHLTNALESA
ncbi:hypothetical protein [Streptomyces sp. NPDC094032]|uniref:hypothetical protein n=1 Tax=Streptomyces sp. NPDC094032 TaxID=3155308 RepID=UPI00332D5ACD